MTGDAKATRAATPPSHIAVMGTDREGLRLGGRAKFNVGNNVITCNDNWEATSGMIASRMIGKQ